METHVNGWGVEGGFSQLSIKSLLRWFLLQLFPALASGEGSDRTTQLDSWLLALFCFSIFFANLRRSEETDVGYDTGANPRRCKCLFLDGFFWLSRVLGDTSDIYHPSLLFPFDLACRMLPRKSKLHKSKKKAQAKLLVGLSWSISGFRDDEQKY